MSAISIDLIKSLREKTGVSMTACKKALEESNGNEEKAIEILRKKGESKASERADRSAGEGIVVSYIHSNNKIGVLVKLQCETDFVAKNEEFQSLAKDIAMHIAATNPKYLNPSEVNEEEIKKEKEIWTEQLKNEGKPENIIENIISGKEKKFREENALLSQSFVKNPEITIEKLINEYVAKVGEKVQIGKFSRFSI